MSPLPATFHRTQTKILTCQIFVMSYDLPLIPNIWINAMKRLTYRIAILLLLAISTQAKIIVVNTTNNVSPGATETNLVQAINALQDGDTIQFNIPGNGPHYLLSPAGGYSAITN